MFALKLILKLKRKVIPFHIFFNYYLILDAPLILTLD